MGKRPITGLGRDEVSDLLTVGDAAKVAGVAAETIRLWERLGKLPAMRTASGLRLFNRADVEQFARRRAARLDAREPQAAGGWV